MGTRMHQYGYHLVAEHQGAKLWLGPFIIDEEDLEVLAKTGVRTVVNLCEESEYRGSQRELLTQNYKDLKVRELRFPTLDAGGLDPGYLEMVISVIIEELGLGNSVYLHCRAGRERSATIALGVICRLESLGLEEGLRILKLRKPNAQPLPQQLKTFSAWQESSGPDNLR